MKEIIIAIVSIVYVVLILISVIKIFRLPTFGAKQKLINIILLLIIPIFWMYVILFVVKRRDTKAVNIQTGKNYKTHSIDQGYF